MVPLEWVLVGPGVQKESFILQLRVKSRESASSKLLVLPWTFVGVLATQMILDRQTQKDKTLNALFLITSACVCLQFHIALTKVSESCACINNLLQFHYKYTQSVAKTSKPLMEKLNLLIVHSIKSLMDLLPLFFSLGLNWGNPRKVTLAGYGLLPDTLDTDGEDKQAKQAHDGLFYWIALVGIYFTNWFIWTLISDATVFVTCMCHILSVNTIISNIQW